MMRPTYSDKSVAFPERKTAIKTKICLAQLCSCTEFLKGSSTWKTKVFTATWIWVERKERTFLLRGFICILCRRKGHRVLTPDLHRFRFVIQVKEPGYFTGWSVAGCENWAAASETIYRACCKTVRAAGIGRVAVQQMDLQKTVLQSGPFWPFSVS